MHRRRFISVTITALAAALALCIAGCSGTGVATDSQSEDAQAITQSVSELLDQLKGGSGEAVTAAEEKVEALVGTQLDDMGVQVDELLSAYLDGFDYSVGDASVTGASGEVAVTLKWKSIPGIVKSFIGGGDLSGEALLSCVENAEISEQTINVYCTKGSDGTWSALDGLVSSITSLAVK